MIIIEGGGPHFAEPIFTIEADQPSEMADALASMQRALDAGHHVAGYFSYELGYALEPKLLPLLPAARGVPLLWFGVYDRPRKLEPEFGRAYAGPIRWEWDQAGYAKRFDRVADYIKAGDIYQANLSMRGRFKMVGDPLGLYHAIGTQPHGAYIDDGERQILSFSPELFFDLDRHGRIVTKPMKGTAPRAGDDASERAKLQASAKDRAENLMIVDLLRNDLSRLGGEVAVTDLFAVETYPTLHQMVSTVTAQLRADSGIAKILRAIFPSGSITGAPKIRAMQIIRELEASPRGVYCGSIGYFAPDGSARFNVAIRTLTIQDGEGELGVGGAVVADSDCAGEYAECLLKARYFESARRPIELIETMRGGVRADLHLARMEASAKIFGIPFDRQAVPLLLGERVRLSLAENGDFAVATAPLSEQRRWSFVIRSRKDDPLLRHKTSWREVYEIETGADEVLFINQRDELCEGSRSNLFLVIDGQWLTPSLSSGLLPGCLRQEMLAAGHCREAVLSLSDLDRAEQIWFGNSLRSLIAATRHADP